MGKKVYTASSLTGGADGSLDSINGSLLNDGDLAIVTVGGRHYLYELDHDNSSAEASPWIISPDKNYGTKRWILQSGGGDYYSGATAYLAADLDISATPAWYEIGSGAETITEVNDYGSNFDVATGRYTTPVAGVYLVSTTIGCKVKDDSQTLVACYTALGVNGSASRYGSSFYGAAQYVFRANSSWQMYVAAGVTLSAFIYAAESASSQPTILGGATENRFSVSLLFKV